MFGVGGGGGGAGRRTRPLPSAEWAEMKARSNTYRSTALSSASVLCWLSPKSITTCKRRPTSL